MPILNISPGPASLLFGVIGGVVGFFIALLLKRRIPGRYSVLICAAIAGIVAELLSGELGGLTSNKAVVLTSRLIGLFVGGTMFRFTYKGEFGPTYEWMGPYLASSFASWTAFAMSLQLIGLVSVLSAVIGGFLASSLSKALSRYLPSTLEQASAMTQVSGLSWVFGFIAYSIGIAVMLAVTGKEFLTPFGLFAASSVALLLSFLFSLPYVHRENVYARLTVNLSNVWKYNASFILLFLFIALLILVGYQKSFSVAILLIAVAGGVIAGVVSGSISYYISKERKGIPPRTFSAVLLGVSAGQGIGVISSLSLDTFMAKLYPASVLELVFLSGVAATIAGFIFAVMRGRKKKSAAGPLLPPPVESESEESKDQAADKKDNQG